MSCVWMCSDWHLGHRGISKRFRTNFESDEAHDQFFLESYLRNVKKRDIVIMLGDMVISDKGFDLISQMPGEKRIILGNHDLDRGRTIEDFHKYFTKIYGVLKYKKFWLTHIPMHPDELYGKINIHGHVHSNTINDDRYVNLCPEFLIPTFGEPIVKFQDLHEWILR